MIYIAVTHRRDVRYIATEYEIDDLFQFEKGKVVCRKDAKVMNQRLDYGLSEYQERLDCIPDKGIYACSQIKEILENKQKLARQTTIKEYIWRKELGTYVKKAEEVTMKENRPIYNYVRIMQRQADAAIRRVIDYTNEPDKFEWDVSPLAG